MKNPIFSYLHFTKSERRGTVILLALGICLYAIPEIWYWLRPQQKTDFTELAQTVAAFREALGNDSTQAQFVDNQSLELFYFDPNVASLEDLIRLGLSEKTAQTICNYREKGGRFRQAEDLGKIWSLPKSDLERLLPYVIIENESPRGGKKEWEKTGETFAFDPNTASEADFERLGLPRWTIKSILNYRSKGGMFKQKEDFKKIYTLGEEDYLRLENYIQVSPTAQANVAEAPRPIAYSGGFVAKSVPSGPIDINRSPLEVWKTLPGIGESRARQIVNFREKLGGFISVAQVGETLGLPDSTYQGIKPYLQLGTTDLRKLNINTLTVNELEAHPYISRKQAEHIVRYREQHGDYASVQDLDKILAFSDKAWLAKVRVYLGVE